MNKVRFKKLSYNAYRLEAQHDPNIIYFILDKPFIFVGDVQYGITLDESKHLINSVKFTTEGKLVYTVAGSSEQKEIPGLSIATETSNGFMSKEHVQKLNSLSTAMGDVTDVKALIDEKTADSIQSWVDVKS